MKTLAKLGLAVSLVLGLVAAGYAGEETTLTGKVLCAKCTLKKAGAAQCQNVLVVQNGDQTTEYYVEKNEVAQKFGHVCTSEKGAIVTGKVTEKDGQKWIAPSKMEEAKKS